MFEVALYGHGDSHGVLLCHLWDLHWTRDLLITFTLCPLLCCLGCDRVLVMSAICQVGQLHLPLLAALVHLQCG